MNVPSQIDPDCLASVFAGGIMEVRWSAVVCPRPDDRRGIPIEQLVFVISIQPVDGRHAILDAWVETGSDTRAVMTRQPITCEIAIDGDLVHVDGFREGERVVAVSVTPASPTTERRLLYAQTTLLGPAGLPPGAYDPPTARLLTREPDAASA